MSYLIEKDGNRERVNSLDGYEDWTVIKEITIEPNQPFYGYNENNEFVPDTNLAEEFALKEIEEKAEVAAEKEIKSTRRQIAISALWGELQLLKLADLTNNVPTDINDRRKMFPTIMAIVALSGNTLTQVATAIENRLWDRRRRLALWEAKVLLANDEVRAAITIEDKLAAVANIDWTE